MREVAFIKQNKAKWLDFEQAIFGKSKKNPDEMASLYIHLVNDLSYAQTYYPKSKTVIYLNYLASQIYQKIYKTKREDKNRFIYFFSTEVPLLVYQYRRYLLYSFLMFFCCVAIGVVSAKYDINFTRLILGDYYVNMTLENIKKGNPVAVYTTGSNWGGFISITYNNLMVGAKCYIYGIFIGIGTFYVMIQNCIMIGTFQYLFYQEGVFWESVRGIWIHGSMEIFGIVIESAAGFILGASILFPNTFSRMNSLKIGFKNSFKIYLSTIPFTFAAGFLEGFITRYAVDMPHWLSIFIILFTLFIISFYYLIFPFIVHKKSIPMFQLFKERKFGDYINDTFQFFKVLGKHFFKIYFVINGSLLLLAMVFVYFFMKVYMDFVFANTTYRTEGVPQNTIVDYIDSHYGTMIALIVGGLLFFLIISIIQFTFPVVYLDLYDSKKGTNFSTKDILAGIKKRGFKILKFTLGYIFIIVPIACIILFLNVLLFYILIGVPLLLITLPAMMSWIVLSFYYYMNSEESFFSALGDGFETVTGQFWHIVFSALVLGIIYYIVTTIFTMVPYLIGIVSLYTSMQAGSTEETFSTLSIMMSLVFVFSIISSYILNNLLLIHQGMIYYSHIENSESSISNDSIDLIGNPSE